MSRWTADACERLRDLLAPIEAGAVTLPWADRTPWTTRRRVRTERRVWGRRAPRDRIVAVDLHGLDKALAEHACTLLHTGLSGGAPTAYLRVVVGRGRRSKDGRRVLAGVVLAHLDPPPAPMRIRSRTLGAVDGHLDLVHPDRWRPRSRRG